TVNQAIAPAETMPATRAASPSDPSLVAAPSIVGGVLYRATQGGLLLVMAVSGFALWWLSRRAG
ncbi:MAG: hypothetical protein NZ518_01825, partial [Dehalococcoidia bacterium]|nr:hypothetical protein [Dehalococcoidia bacterium]